jgi:dTDP-4-dehydrorhamnose reductase
MRVAILGSSGQLGQTFRRKFGSISNVELVCPDRFELDLSNTSSIENWLVSNSPDCIFNCAAYTKVEQAEDDVFLAESINARALIPIAEFANQHKVSLLHFSTDYVFDGKSNLPYRETDVTRPLNAYGRTKLQGEIELLERCPNATIIRISWLFSEFGHNFLKTMLKLFEERNTVQVVQDQIASPTYAGLMVDDLITWWQKDPTFGGGGLYHYAQEGEASWFDFALEIAKLVQADVVINPVQTVDFPSRALRPTYSKLDATHFIQTSGIVPEPWQLGLQRCLENLRFQ